MCGYERVSCLQLKYQGGNKKMLWKPLIWLDHSKVIWPEHSKVIWLGHSKVIWLDHLLATLQHWSRVEATFGQVGDCIAVNTGLFCLWYSCTVTVFQTSTNHAMFELNLHNLCSAVDSLWIPVQIRDNMWSSQSECMWLLVTDSG